MAFNPHAPEYLENPFPTLARLRERATPYFWMQGWSWVISRHDVITAVLRDRRFATQTEPRPLELTVGTAAQLSELVALAREGLIGLSDQAHTRVRRLASPAFTPPVIEWLRPDIQAIVDELLDAPRARGALNVDTDFANPLPLRAICAMLKIPRESAPLFQRFSRALARAAYADPVSSEELARLRVDASDGLSLLNELVEERQRNPLGRDFLTTLLQVREQDDQLTTREVLSLVSNMLLGGLETTSELINFTVLNLLQRPDVLARMKAEPALIKNVVEEVHRFDNFGKLGTTRYAIEDVQLQGVTIHKGQKVVLLLNSALRDEAAYEHADVFDAARGRTANLAFGHGPHYCLGAGVARLIVQLAVGTLFQRYPETRLQGAPVFRPHPLIRKLDALTLRLTCP